MSLVTPTAKGQITLRKDLLNHLGLKAGQQIEILKMPNGKLCLEISQRNTVSWDEISGMLAGLTDKVATIEEMNEAIADGWAGINR